MCLKANWLLLSKWILELLNGQRLDLMLVIGGYNSSNTGHLAELSKEYTAAFHIDDAGCMLSAAEIRHLPPFTKEPKIGHDWLPPSVKHIGLTAGASTPNNKIGETVQRLAELLDVDLAEVLEK